MPKKPKRKLTRAEKAAKAQRRAEFMTIFINGRQKQVRRPQLVEGLPVDEFIRRNADPIWLHQNEMWEEMTPEADDGLLSIILPNQQFLVGRKDLTPEPELPSEIDEWTFEDDEIPY